VLISVSAKQRPSATVHAIPRPGFLPYAVTPFLGGPLFNLLLCNGRCLCLLMGIFQEINSTPHWRIGCLHQSCWHCAFVWCRSHTEWLTGVVFVLCVISVWATLQPGALLPLFSNLTDASTAWRGLQVAVSVPVTCDSTGFAYRGLRSTYCHLVANSGCIPLGRACRRTHIVPASKAPTKFIAANDMDPGAVPETLQDLTTVEQMLIARVAPVMSVMRLPEYCGGQWRFKGHVVCFPPDIQPVITVLPLVSVDVFVLRSQQSANAVLVCEFRVRRQKVHDALFWLMEHNGYHGDISV